MENLKGLWMKLLQKYKKDILPKFSVSKPNISKTKIKIEKKFAIILWRCDFRKKYEPPFFLFIEQFYVIIAIFLSLWVCS